jgi:nucleotide-binding universal stress UspA family protein
MNTVAESSDNTVVGSEGDRTFLVVVDDTEELASVLRYACNRARFTGGKVALLFVIDMDSSQDFQHWQFVGNLMEEEAMEAAEQTLNRHAAQISKESGSSPTQYIRKGKTREELFALIAEQPGISNLLLGSAPGEKPGPLVEAVTAKYAGQTGIPVTIIPGSLTLDEIDSLT